MRSSIRLYPLILFPKEAGWCLNSDWNPCEKSFTDRIGYEVLHDPDAVFVLRFWHAARGTPQIDIEPG